MPPFRCPNYSNAAQANVQNVYQAAAQDYWRQYAQQTALNHYWPVGRPQEPALPYAFWLGKDGYAPAKSKLPDRVLDCSKLRYGLVPDGWSP